MERLLDPLRTDDELPPSTVDIERAVRSGRRIRARWTVAGVAALVMVLVAVPIAWFGSGAPPPGPLGPGTEPAPGPGFDPLRRAIAFTGMPGVTPHSYSTGRNFQQFELEFDVSHHAWVVAFAPGRHDDFAPGAVKPDSGTPTEPVAGRPAYLLDRSPAGFVAPTLAWQWTDGGWAFVNLLEPAGDPGDRLRQVALATRIGGDEPVTVPFTTSAPANYRLIGVSGQLRGPDDPFVRVDLRFGQRDPDAPNQDRREYGGVLVSVENGQKMGAALGANQVVDGHPAMVSDDEVIIFGVLGTFAVDVAGFPDRASAIAAAREVRFVPDPADRSTWTTRPVRG